MLMLFFFAVSNECMIGFCAVCGNTPGCWPSAFSAVQIIGCTYARHLAALSQHTPGAEDDSTNPLYNMHIVRIHFWFDFYCHTSDLPVGAANRWLAPEMYSDSRNELSGRAL